VGGYRATRGAIGDSIGDGGSAATAKDRKVKPHLLQCLPDGLLMQVAKKTGKEVWDGLKVRGSWEWIV
jgi:hypothetical protein